MVLQSGLEPASNDYRSFALAIELQKRTADRDRTGIVLLERQASYSCLEDSRITLLTTNFT